MRKLLTDLLRQLLRQLLHQLLLKILRRLSVLSWRTTKGTIPGARCIVHLDD